MWHYFLYIWKMLASGKWVLEPVQGLFKSPQPTTTENCIPKTSYAFQRAKSLDRGEEVPC